MTPLFRGKRKDNGQWVEGYLYQDPTGTYIKRGNMSTRFGCGVDVIPETVGMASPFTDKNGKRMFQHDTGTIYNSKIKVCYGFVNVDLMEVFCWYIQDANGMTLPISSRNQSEIEITSSIHD